jgi:dipeptidyl aminopeptidase/acylaminoacyl peptidase
MFFALSALALASAMAAPYKVSEVVAYIPNEGRMIPATICLPVGAPGQTFPAVVMLHGTGSARDEAGNGYKLFAPYMAERGIASIRIDFAGSGDSKADYVEYTWTSGASDAVAAAQFLRQFRAVDPARIGIMGWSQGGSVAMLAAARNPSFKALLTWAGALDMSSYIADQYPEAKARGYTKMNFDWRGPLNVSLAWFEDVRNIKLASELGKFKGPVLAIAGTDDTDVPLAYLDQIVASAGGTDKGKLLIKGADHTFRIFTGDMSKFNELMDATAAWFQKKL